MCKCKWLTLTQDLHSIYMTIDTYTHNNGSNLGSLNLLSATMNKHPPVHHPLDACYDTVVDDPQLSYYPVSSW